MAPTKINEYLAVGRPVVSTDLPWVLEHQQEHAVVEVSVAEPEAFVAAVERALAQGSPPELARSRREAASRYDWTTRLEWVSRLIDELARTAPPER